MGETFTGKFVLDTSDAQGSVNTIQSQTDKATRNIENAKVRLSTYFEQALHAAHVMAMLISRTAWGQATQARMQDLSMGLNIASAEMQVGLALKRGIAEMATNPVAAAAQFGLAVLMQGAVTQMSYLRMEQRQFIAQQEQAAQYFDQYT